MIEINKIHRGDSLKLLQKIENESVDLVIADPPYNLGKDFGNNSDKWDNVGEWVEWSKKWIQECHRILKPTGSIFIYGIHHYICYIQCSLYELGMNYGRMFIWHYENGWSMYTKSPAATYEPLLWFTKSGNYTYHTIREPYKSEERLKHKIIKNGKIWHPNPDGKRGGDVWKIPTLAGKRFENEKVNHPTQKPLAISEKIINHFSNKGDLIVVPFVGSGSEVVAAKKLQRKFIGMEINNDYVKIAEKRLNELDINQSINTDRTQRTINDSDIYTTQSIKVTS